MTDSTPDLSKLPRSQRRYFEILESMEPDASLRRAIAAAKRDLIAQAERASAEDGFQPEEPTASSELSYSGEGSEVELRILLDRTEDGYYGEISEGISGSQSDTGGRTVAEAVESALYWAGVTGLKLDPEATASELRTAFQTAASTASFGLTVQLYTSF